MGNYVKACATCAHVKDPPRTPKAPLTCVRACHPLQRVAIDIVVPLPRSNSGHEWLLVKFAQAFPLRNITSELLANQIMDEYICRFGCFESVHSDQGSNVDVVVLRELCDLIEAAKTRTTPYHPQGDGQVERLNKSLVKIICKLVSEHRRDWAAHVPRALLVYNSSVHESTGYTPYCLMFGREARLPIDAVLKLYNVDEDTLTYPEYVIHQKKQIEQTERLVRENLRRAQVKQKTYDSKSVGRLYQEGDRVWYRNRLRNARKKFIKRWCGPWRIVKALFDVTYRIEEETRKPGKRRLRKVVYFNYLKPCHSPPEEPQPYVEGQSNTPKLVQLQQHTDSGHQTGG